MASPEPKLTEEEVLAELYLRDRREYPVMTIAEIAEVIENDDTLADVTRKTVERKVKSLVEKGAIQERKHGRLGIYWVEYEGEGACPSCSRPLVSRARVKNRLDEESAPTDPYRFICYACDTEFAATHHPTGADTQLGKLIGRGLAFMDWWRRLGGRTRKWFKKLTKIGFQVEYPDKEYPEESLTVAEGGFDTLTEEQLANAGEGVYADEEAEDTEEHPTPPINGSL